MGTKTITFDDLDGSTNAVTPVKFSVDDSLFEIDLSEGNANELRTLLAPYQAVARPIPLRRGKSKNRLPASSTKRPTATTASPSNSEVRAWAKKKRIEVSARGPIPAPVMKRFLAETSG